MWTNEFRSTQSFVLLSPYCSLVSCAIFGRMQPKTGTTTSSIMNTTKSRQGNKRGINKHLTLRIMGTTEHEEPRFFFILNKGAKSGGEITHAVLNGSIVSKPAGWDAFHGLALARETKQRGNTTADERTWCRNGNRSSDLTRLPG